MQSGGYTYCAGTVSCLQATLYPSFYLFVDGYNALEDSIVYAGSAGLWANIYSGWATENTTFYSDGNTVKIHFIGYYSGYDADIYCTDGTVYCYITCWEDACSGVTVYYDSTAPVISCADGTTDCVTHLIHV